MRHASIVSDHLPYAQRSRVTSPYARNHMLGLAIGCDALAHMANGSVPRSTNARLAYRFERAQHVLLADRFNECGASALE
jgi:hypothetical protein